MGRVDAAIEVWEECLEFHRSQEDLRRMGDLHRKIGAGLWHKGERKQALDHYQKGTNLLKDGPPCLELVRLYEEAAWLYMHAGDNMLAIYASEKALRLAERLGETRAASRAHGIFGRVFGRIGDSAKARENLERSVELARGSDEGETIRALLALGNHLEISDADYDAAGASYTEALTISQRVGDLPGAGRAARRARARWPSTAPTGRPSRSSPRTAPSWPSARASSASCACRTRRAGCCAGAAATGTAPRRPSGAPPSWPTRSAGPRSASRRCSASRRSCATAASSATPRPCSRRRSTSASAPGLIAQSIQAMSSRALILALGGRMEQARDAASEAADLADRLHYPVGQAAALEAQGVTDEDLDNGQRPSSSRPPAAWTDLGRPLDAARCRLALGKRLAKHGDARAREMLEAVSAELDELGVPHLAAVAREAVEAAAK